MVPNRYTLVLPQMSQIGEQYSKRDRQQREQTTGERVFGYISLLSNLEGIFIWF